MNEEEAVEMLKRIDIKFFLSAMIEQSNYIIDEADKVNKAIETVLNLLEKKDAEITKLKNNNKELLRKLRNRVKEVKKLTKYSLYKTEFSNLNKQLKKKDKIIDEMAEWISNRCFYKDDYSNICEVIQDSCYKETECKECVKEYFTKKVEG